MQNWKKIVVKIGTNVLTDADGLLDEMSIHQIADQVIRLKQKGLEVVMVSSGAVGAGQAKIELPKNLNKITKRQALAAIGQIDLINRYTKYFNLNGLQCAQVLATKEDFRDRLHYVNMKRCLMALMRDQIVPIVNENDVIAISELMFTDNDELSGLIASLVNADALIILSNVNGVYELGKEKELIREIEADDNSVFNHISGVKSEFGRGGMHTKVHVCQKAASLGIQAYIVNGKTTNVLLDLAEGQNPGTFFKPKKKHSAIKKWMAHNVNAVNGEIKINDGAERALRSPDTINSLLPIGIIEIQGKFKKGDIVQIINEQGSRIGIGKVAYGAKKARNLMGEKGKKPIIHYDYLLVND